MILPCFNPRNFPVNTQHPVMLDPKFLKKPVEEATY